MMEEDTKRRLKSAELQAKKDRLRLWTNYVPPATNSKAIHDQNFTGKVSQLAWIFLRVKDLFFVESSAPLGFYLHVLAFFRLWKL